jgi:hypothetical protein
LVCMLAFTPLRSILVGSENAAHNINIIVVRHYRYQMHATNDSKNDAVSTSAQRVRA